MDHLKRVLAYSEPAEHDVFDPKPAGYNPFTLEQAVRAAQHALNNVETLLDALEGCQTPLDLTAAHAKLEGMEAFLDTFATDLFNARAVLKEDMPLAKIADGEHSPWTESSDNPVLTPAAVVELAVQATEDELAPSITYRQAIRDYGLVPSLAVERITPEAQEARRQNESLRIRESKRARFEFHQELLADMESIPCDMCGADAGTVCRTKTGRISKPHSARRYASPLAQEYPQDAILAERPDTEREWVPGPGSVPRQKKPDAPEPVEPPMTAAEVAEQRAKARIAVSALASNLSNLNR